MIKTTFQENSNDCAIACLVMIAGHYGLTTTVQKLSGQMNGDNSALSAHDIVLLAEQLNFNSRVLRLEPDEIAQLKIPCLLHWKMNHFVVLESVCGDRFTIIDPSRGKRKISLNEINCFFSGVALEFTPSETFLRRKVSSEISLTNLAAGLKTDMPSIANIVIMVALLEALGLLAPLVSQVVIDGAITSLDKDFLLLAAIGGIFLALLQFTVGVFGEVAKLRLSQRISLRWSSNLFRHLMNLPWSYFQSRQVGDISNRFSALKSIREFLLTSIISSWADLVVLAVTCALMIAYSPTLFWIVAIASFCYAITQILSYPFLKNATTERVALSSTEHAHFLESIRSALTIKMSGSLAGRVNNWANLVVDVQNRDTATQKIQIMISAANTLIFSIESMCVLYVAGMLIIDSHMSIGMLVAFIAFKGNFTSRISRLVETITQWHMQSVHCERLADIALHESEYRNDIRTIISDTPLSIELVNISFRHKPEAPWILKNVNLTVCPSDSLAIIGRSGSGKSTLVKLILGLLQPTEGHILINGVRLEEFGTASVRDLIGTVLQEDQVLNGTIAENIAGFDLDACISEVQSASQSANLHKIICRLPMGYQTNITNSCSTLSSGQKQRLYLARALYKKPKILILDEATNNLDLHSEQHIILSLKSMKITLISIAHRVETLALASRIISIENGEISHIQTIKHNNSCDFNS